MQKIEAKETSSQSGSMALATTTPLQSSIEEIEKEFGLDKPLWERFFIMARQYLQFDFGKSYFSKEPVIEMVKQRLPVSISLGLWSSLLIYLISIPLGIRKAVRHGSPFDTITSFMMMVGYAIPSFLFALLLIIFFAGGSFFSFFPLRGLVSSNWDQLSFGKKILDYLWHMALPLTTQVVGSFASLSFLTKNAFLEEISKQYVTAARAQGFTERHVLFRHVFRNAMLVVLAGLPATLMQIFFSGSILIETIFSLDGLGMMGYEAVLRRDYPVIFGSLYLFTLMGLLLHILSDLLYTWIDPRIHFGRRSSK